MKKVCTILVSVFIGTFPNAFARTDETSADTKNTGVYTTKTGNSDDLYQTNQNQSLDQITVVAKRIVPNSPSSITKDENFKDIKIPAGALVINAPSADAPADDVPQQLTPEQQTIENNRTAELKNNADAMKKKEQSDANKILGAASIGATGIGGGQMLQGKAEQSVDKESEADMKAYLATFRCDYGQGQNIKGGDTEIILPGGNELLPLYTEYKELANGLRKTKTKLNITPGIESELILDKANTGLYDNASLGKTGGGYTSLSRALTDKNSADAAAWDAQKAQSASDAKTGMLIAGAGIVGGIAGNLAINSAGKDGKNIFGKAVATENSAGINKKYDDLIKKTKALKEQIDSEKPAEYDKSGEESDATPETPAPQTQPNPATEKAQQEVLATIKEIKAEEKQSDKDIIKETLCSVANCDANGNLIFSGVNFDTNKSDIKQSAESLLRTAADAIKQIQTDERLSHLNIIVNIMGHTDSAGSAALNNKLSQSRAESVKLKLIEFGVNNINITTVGLGKTKPVADNKTADGRAQNRRVEIEVLGIQKDSAAVSSDSNASNAPPLESDVKKPAVIPVAVSKQTAETAPLNTPAPIAENKGTDDPGLKQTATKPVLSDNKKDTIAQPKYIQGQACDKSMDGKSYNYGVATTNFSSGGNDAGNNIRNDSENSQTTTIYCLDGFWVSSGEWANKAFDSYDSKKPKTITAAVANNNQSTKDKYEIGQPCEGNGDYYLRQNSYELALSCKNGKWEQMEMSGKLLNFRMKQGCNRYDIIRSEGGGEKKSYYDCDTAQEKCMIAVETNSNATVFSCCYIENGFVNRYDGGWLDDVDLGLKFDNCKK